VFGDVPLILLGGSGGHTNIIYTQVWAGNGGEWWEWRDNLGLYIE
jgi:hypothetical protein